MVNPISLDPESAACMGVSPISMCRAMFSIITIASSTTKPVAMVSAIKVRLLMEKPSKYITPKVPIKDKGTATLGIKVAWALLRNTKITSTTKAMESMSSICTSSTEARMVTVRSFITCTSSDSGKFAFNWGSAAMRRCTVSITLAPGWRWMLMMMASRSLAQALRRTFSGASTKVATSLRRNGLPFLYAKMSEA